MTANSKYICLCDINNNLYIISEKGIHLGSYILPSPIYSLTLNDNCTLFCITINGDGLLFDIEKYGCICETNINPLIQCMSNSIVLPSEITILRLFVTSNSIPVITLKINENIRGFAYDNKMKLWSPIDSYGFFLSEYYSVFNKCNIDKDQSTLSNVQIPLRSYHEKDIGTLFNSNNNDIQV